jgi:hypothetical protein
MVTKREAYNKGERIVCSVPQIEAKFVEKQYRLVYVLYECSLGRNWCKREPINRPWP